jgi:hypothetical protein
LVRFSFLILIGRFAARHPSANWRGSRRRRTSPRDAKHGALDFTQAHSGWADTLGRTLG